ncbi:Phosphoglycerate mutase-like protein [Venustampulla echinocandica]|uniref:Phosphoglycerate mutase-like protein n=1 Tax=Venustampulla echinocandica TaxID=2656787 RepID=A0A370TRS3_9HELO|nr:Phosphoglycerate mutase-like protein [Venustampulla echinocandica]RDL38232.1 Phosphoglycerate mutase-like protein [Venustampulla echinocandica]
MPAIVVTGEPDKPSISPPRRQAQLSDIAKGLLNHRSWAAMPSSNAQQPAPPDAITNITADHFQLPESHVSNSSNGTQSNDIQTNGDSRLAPPMTVPGRALHPPAVHHVPGLPNSLLHGINHTLSDTPLPSAPTSTPASPRLFPVRQNSGITTPRVRPPATTLNIPGMTRSRVSPDGKISQRDVGAKLVVIMVGLPARGKSYITKKIQRYLSWQQYETRIFNVGNRRRGAAIPSQNLPEQPIQDSPVASPPAVDAPTQAARILLNGLDPEQGQPPNRKTRLPSAEEMDQSAKFFDPQNTVAAQLRDQVAMSTLDELLDFLLNQGGSVGILDATNSTIQRRQLLFDRVKEREPKLGILFIESVCEDKKLLETNMRLKLRGPDYRDKDPESSLADFKKRVEAYESAYVPLGQYEEDHNMQYIKMINVGQKVIHYQLQGFLSCGIASYLATFNLSPSQIWITRHGKSEDNCLGKLGGDSELTMEGRNYATVLYNFITLKRSEWEEDQMRRASLSTELPPKPGDRTPPYPELLGDLDAKNFCVWTSMLKRSRETAADFDEDENYDVKNWEILNEIHAGKFEGMTYEDIKKNYPEEYAKRAKDKLNYIYPGVGGEGYLQVINRLRDMVRELERIKDHVLIIGHRSVCRVLMAYFMDLTRDDIADLDVPLGLLFSIEPKPYGIEFHAYRYNEKQFWFDELVDYKPQRETEKGN